ncbi:hypothetical protein FRC02_010306 [Tulasnella sp. 418]|nr:hypothetical protein FRC02_010306 [Tulasnella sp. 418]
MTDFKIHRIAPKIAPKALGIQDYDVEHLDLTGRIELLKKVDQGGFSDIWLGRLRNKDGNTFEVAVKELRMQGKPLNRSYKALLRDRFCQEVVLWSKLCHPNIVPLLGYIVTVDKETAFPGLISPWYNKGDVVNYLKANPEANRKQFLLDVVSALQYLHGLAFIHGDIKGGNVLIDMNDKACLCDFGMSKLHKDVEELTDYVGTRGTPRFTAPEVLNSSHSTTMSDIWSFGCLAIQIMLDQLPYQHKKTKFSVHEANLAGKPPLLVRDIVRNPAEELFWHQIQQCWNVDATKRPTAEKLVTEISNLITASPVVNLDITKNVILGELIAQDQHWETRSAKLMTEISTTTVVVRAYGGYDSQITIDIQKELCEKISCWSSMRHLNVTPTVGYILEPSNLALPSIVLPPDVEQSIDELLSSTSDANKFQLLLDVARGLNYLHHIGVVHGDIRPCNIYVGVNGTASLGGYWTSSYTEITETDPDFALDKSDSLRFTSPEILYHQKKTATTDIWAIGCLAIKILINYTPYKEIDDTEQLEAAIKSGQRPIPAQYKISNLPHIHLWGCIKQCWSHDPSQRPRVTELVAALADVETLPHVETFDLSKSLQVGARVFQGVNSDLHKGLLKPNNVNVAVKLLRVGRHNWQNKLSPEERLQKESSKLSS